MDDVGHQIGASKFDHQVSNWNWYLTASLYEVRSVRFCTNTSLPICRQGELQLDGCHFMHACAAFLSL